MDYDDRYVYGNATPMPMDGIGEDDVRYDWAEAATEVATQISDSLE